MKANAPEKIYLQEPTKVRTEKKYDNDIEYVRKDAFVENAANWLINNTDITPTGIKNFRKAMKGE